MVTPLKLGPPGVLISSWPIFSLREPVSDGLTVPVSYWLQGFSSHQADLNLHSVFSSLYECWGGILPCDLNFLMDLRKVIDCQFVSCKDGSDDFQILCILELKPKVLIVFYFCDSLLKCTCSIIHSFGIKLCVLTNLKLCNHHYKHRE